MTQDVGRGTIGGENVGSGTIALSKCGKWDYWGKNKCGKWYFHFTVGMAIFV